MKNTTTPAKLITGMTLAVTFSGFVACGSEKAEDPKREAEKINDEKFDDRKVEKDAQFLVNAAEINYQEMELGELAQSNGYDSIVKKLGRMMVEEHVKLSNDLKKLAAGKGITLPEAVSEKGRKECDRLGKRTGKDFDKAYCDMMVKGHKEAISKFEDAARDGMDKDIRDWAFSSLPVLSRHLDHFVTCSKKDENNGERPE